MERELTHRQIQELLGAYALDAVDPDEAEEVKRHLEGCPRCREEVAAHREAAAMLAHVGAPAPEGVWDRIAEQLGEPSEDDAGLHRGAAGGLAAGRVAGRRSSGEGTSGSRPGQAFDRDRSGETAESRSGGPAGAGEGVSEREANQAAERITSLADARADESGSGRRGRAQSSPFSLPSTASRRTRSGPSRLVSAGLAVAAALALVLGVQLVRVNNRLANIEQLALQSDVEDAALSAAAAPDARRVRLASDDGMRFADAVLLPNGQAYLIARGLPALSDAETYQLWAVIGDQKISVGVLGSKPTVTAFAYDADPSLLAITAERAGGVVASEKQAVVVGAVEPKST